MKRHHTSIALTSLTLVGLLASTPPAFAQVAGSSTTMDTSVTTMTQIAMGWSVKKTLMGKTVYNEAGKKVGKVEDLIISPDKSVSYVIIGAGGFVGIGRHDVAIPVTQIQDRAGKLVMPGATQDMIKTMPQFEYASDTSKRDQFVAAADKDIANGKAKIAELEKRAATAASDAKAKIDIQISALKLDVKAAETKVNGLKHASVSRWREFESDVSAATARLRKSIDSAKG
jgi:sporulation protein YlmC with PRC-barrel domain